MATRVKPTPFVYENQFKPGTPEYKRRMQLIETNAKKKIEADRIKAAKSTHRNRYKDIRAAFGLSNG